MKNIVFLICIFILQSYIFAANYYVSNSGSDANLGTLAQPWQSLAKVNNFQTSLVAGDQVLFERGGVFRGGITLSKGGISVVNQITYGAYGSGAKPQLLGSTSLSGWASIGGDKWTINAGQIIEELFVNDKRQIPARYPNTKYIPIENSVGTSSITNGTLNFGNWTGARVVVRVLNDYIGKGRVISQAGNTINVSFTGVQNLPIGNGFYIDHALAALDVANEWYQDPNTFLLTVKMPSGVNPNNQICEGSVENNGIESDFLSFFKISDLSFKYYKQDGISIKSTKGVTIQNCNFKNINERGIELRGNWVSDFTTSTATDVIVDSCTFFDINSEALDVVFMKDLKVTRNFAKRIALHAGFERDAMNAGFGFFITINTGADISYNRIDSTGYSCLSWGGEKNIIYRNELSNNGQTKNDNGFMQTWGGFTKYNLVKENILHDGFGNEDGMANANTTYAASATSRGASEGIYFDDFTSNNTVTGNTVYNTSKGIFIQSSKNFEVRDNTTYNCDTYGIFLNEKNLADPFSESAQGWVRDVENISVKKNVFYQVRDSPITDHMGMRWSSYTCNSSVNFGISDSNYVFNPYKKATFVLGQSAGPSCNNIETIHTLATWQSATGQDMHTKVNSFAWNEYLISTTGPNLIANGTFETDLSNWNSYGTGTINWEVNASLTGGTLKAAQTGASYEIQGPNIAILAGKTYVVSYSIIGNRDGVIRPSIVSKYPNFNYIYSVGNHIFNTQKTNYQYVFTAPLNITASGVNYGLHFYTQANGDVVWVDNVSIYEIATLQPDDYLNRSKLFVNNQISPQTFSLGSNVYKDLDGNAVCGSITVAPYRSRILILDESVGIPTILGSAGILCNNVQTTLTATGYVGPITWQQSSDGQFWNNALGTVVNPNVFTTNTLSTSTYFRINTNSTVCANLSSAPYLVTLLGKGKIMASKNPICDGESVILTFTGIVGSYKWRTSQTLNQSVWTDASGINDKNIYTATGLNQNSTFNVSINGVCGITTSLDINIIVNPNVNPTLTYWPRCNNSVVSPTLSNSNAGFYSTSTVGIYLNPSTGEIAPSSITGSITIQYTKYAVGACPQKFISTTFNLNPPPPISFQPNLTFCGGYPFTIVGTGGIIFDYWENNGAGKVKLAVVETAPGLYLYEARALDSGTGCRNSKFAEVTILPNYLPTITGAASLTYCQYTIAPATDFTNKVLGTGLRWYNSTTSGYDSAPIEPVTGVVGSPAYSMRVSKDNGACISPILSIPVNINPTSIANFNPLGNSNICYGSNVVLTSTSAINNQWYKNGQTIPYANTNILTISTPGIYNLKVGSGLCTDTLPLGSKITIYPLPNVSLSLSPSLQSVCTGTGAFLTINNSEIGVIYQPYNGTIPLVNTMVGTGSTIILTIPSSNLSIGGNNINVKATAQNINSSGLNSVLANPAPTIDGNLTESGWNINKTLAKCIDGSPCPSDNSVEFGTMWDNTYLYVGVKIKDPNTLYNSSNNFWETDGIEIYIDGNNDKSGSYDAFDKQYILRYGDMGHVIFEKSNTAIGVVAGSGVSYEWKSIPNGYAMEVAIPWARIGISPPNSDNIIGFDLGNNDYDDATMFKTTRDFQTVYAGFSQNYQDNSQFANMPLIGNQNFCAGTVNLTTTAIIQVNPSPIQPTFNYGNIPICNNSGTVNLSTFAGTGGGTFVANGALPINSATGSVTVTGYNGQFTVSYSTSGSGGCGSVSGFTNLTITSPPIAPTFSYGINPFCNNSISIATTSGNGIVGGTFSATNGLTINSSTGLIIVNSFVGISTISYKIPAANGCGSVSGISVITISSAPNVPSFSYGSSLYCNSTSTISILTGTGLNGGAFAATNGININSSNGLITINNFAGISLISYTVAASNGCGSVSGMATITLTSAPTQPTFNFGANRYCNSTLSINPSTISGVSGGYFTATGGLSINSIAGILSTNALFGTFDITYLIPANGGCASISGTTTITIDGANTTPSMSYNSPVCKSVAMLNPAGTNITGGLFSYSTSGTNVLNINTLTGLVNLTASGVGNYTIQFTKNANGICNAVTTTTSLIINADEVATFSYPSALICNITSGSILPSITGQTAGGNYSYTTSGSNSLFINSSTGEITPSLSGVGNYTIKYQTVGACAKSATFTLSVGNSPITADFSFTGSSFCSNDANPQATGIGSGNVQFLSLVSSTGIGNLVWTDQIQGIINLSTSGKNQTYTIKNIVNIVGCGTDTQYADVTINAAPIVSVSSSSPSICTGNSVTFTGFGATNYTWLPSSVIGNIYSFVPINTSTVSVTGSFANGCMATTTIGVTVNTLPVVTITSSPPSNKICDGEWVILRGNGAVTYDWSTGTNGNDIAFRPTITGIYSVIGTDLNYCTSTDFVTITVNSVPNAPTGTSPAPICVGSTAPILTANGINLKWYSVSTLGIGNISAPNPSVVNTAPITITAFVSQTVNGCESSDRHPITTEVKAIPTVIIASNKDELCFQNSYSVNSTSTGTNGVSNYKWYANTTLLLGSSATVSDTDYNLPIGVNSMRLVATPTQSCGNITTIASNIVVITVSSLPTQPNFNYTQTTICSDVNSLNLAPGAINITNATTWSIDRQNVGVTLTNGTLSINTSASGNYRITAINASGSCAVKTVSSTITINTKPIFPPNLYYSKSTICSNRQENLTLTNSSLLTGFTSDIVGLVVQNGTIIFPTTALGYIPIIYTISVAGCIPLTTTLGITITSAPVLTSISYGTQPLCQTGMKAVTKLGDEGGIFITSPAGIVVNSTTGLIDLTKSKTGKNYTISYTIAGNNACEGIIKSTNVDIIAPTPFSISAPELSEGGICEQNFVQVLLNYTSNNNISWKQRKSGESDAQWIAAENSSTDLFKLTTFLLSESMEYQVVGGINECPSLAEKSNLIIVKVSLTSKSGTITVSDSAPEEPEAEICGVKSSTEITLADYRGNIQWQWASDTDSTQFETIIVNNKTSLSDPILITPQITQFINFKLYRAMVVNGKCPAVFSNIAKVRTCKKSDVVPNALTPNTFDDNATWDIGALRLPDLAEINIYNRYGTLLFKSTGKEMRDRPWDGGGLPAATYFYVIDQVNGSKPLSGAVTIIK